jgi:hypothetical protein
VLLPWLLLLLLLLLFLLLASCGRRVLAVLMQLQVHHLCPTPHLLPKVPQRAALACIHPMLPLLCILELLLQVVLLVLLVGPVVPR